MAVVGVMVGSRRLEPTHFELALELVVYHVRKRGVVGVEAVHRVWYCTRWGASGVGVVAEGLTVE